MHVRGCAGCWQTIGFGRKFTANCLQRGENQYFVIFVMLGHIYERMASITSNGKLPQLNG